MSKKHIRTVGAFLEYDDKFLILLRNKESSNGNLWGLPAGKVKDNESDMEAITREVQEETGLVLEEDNVKLVNVYRWEYPTFDIDFPTFRVKLDKQYDITINPNEHQAYKWVTPEECLELKDNLIHNFEDLINEIYFNK